MNRKADLGWSLETIGKMVFFALILIALIYMAYALVGLFLSGQEGYTARRNLELVVQRIEIAQKQKESKATIVLEMPSEYTLVSFNPDEQSRKVFFDYKTTLSSQSYKSIGMPPQVLVSNAMNGIPATITRPGILSCRGTCLCLIQDSTLKVVTCSAIDIPKLNVFYGEVGVHSVAIVRSDQLIEVGYVGTTAEKPGTWSAGKDGEPVQVIDYAAIMT